MRTESYKCDGPGCTHVKGESNHWFVAVKILGSLTIKPWAGIAAGMLHLCGESCVQKVVSEFLSNQPRRNETGNSASLHPSPDYSRSLPVGVVVEGHAGAWVQEIENGTITHVPPGGKSLSSES